MISDRSFCMPIYSCIHKYSGKTRNINIILVYLKTLD